MRKRLRDRKSALAVMFLDGLNRIVLKLRFGRRLLVRGLENLPATGSYLLVSNHTTRWDGLIVRRLINRNANFMVAPGELTGLQGLVLPLGGAFPADSHFDLRQYFWEQVVKGEPMVIFPEGDIYRDGVTHRFKSGAARMALTCGAAAVPIPVIPIAIRHLPDGTAMVSIGKAIAVEPYVAENMRDAGSGVRNLTSRMYREVSGLCEELGAENEEASRNNLIPLRSWMPRTERKLSVAAGATGNSVERRETKYLTGASLGG
jgi:1-acyl-sn-glycerol-3-phosphate acyltransferase